MEPPRRRITLDARRAKWVAVCVLLIWAFGFAFSGWLDAMVEDPSFLWTTVVLSFIAVGASLFS